MLKSHAFLINSGASNHMVASKESFSSLQITNGLSIHMGDDTQIQAKGKGSIKIKHGVFKDVLYVPSLAAKFLSVYQMTHNFFFNKNHRIYLYIKRLSTTILTKGEDNISNCSERKRLSYLY